MSKQQKLIAKFLAAKKDFKWVDLVALLQGLGYQQQEGNGSRVKFDNGDPDHMINLHKPHPDKEIKIYALKQIKNKLTDAGLI